MNAEYQQASKGLLWSGIALVILGTLTILSPWVSSLAITIVVGIAALSSGAVYIIHAFYDKYWSGFFWSLLAGIIAIIAGGLLIFKPLTGMVALTLLISGFLFVQGITKTVIALSMRQQKGWVWLLISGIAGIILGALIWYYWRENPITSSAWILSLLFGIDLLIAGWSLIMLAAQVRKYGITGIPEPSKPNAKPRDNGTEQNYNARPNNNKHP